MGASLWQRTHCTLLRSAMCCGKPTDYYYFFKYMSLFFLLHPAGLKSTAFPGTPPACLLSLISWTDLIAPHLAVLAPNGRINDRFGLAIQSRLPKDLLWEKCWNAPPPSHPLLSTAQKCIKWQKKDRRLDSILLRSRKESRSAPPFPNRVSLNSFDLFV